MSKLSVVTFTTAAMGSGKTYRRCAHFIINEFLPYHEGVHWSNFPINIDAMAKLAKKKYNVSEEETRRRVRVIPREVMDTWVAGTSGPWDFFRGAAEHDADVELEEGEDERPSLQGCHVAIDEAHLVLPSASATGGRSTDRQNKWRAYLQEVRHRGATFEFITQVPTRFDKQTRDMTERHLQIVNLGQDKDPLFGVRYNDWYEMKGMILRRWSPCIVETEFHLQGTKLKKIDTKCCWLHPEYYAVYDSFSAPVEGGQGSIAPKYEFQKRGPLRMVLWFVFRNVEQLAIRGVMIAAAVWFFGLGGIGDTMQFVFNTMKMDLGVSASAEELPAEAEAAVAGTGQPATAKAAGLSTAAAAEIYQPPFDGFAPDMDPKKVFFRTDINGQQDEYRLEDFGAVVMDNASMTAEIERLQQKVSAYDKQEDLVAVTGTGALFASGEYVRIGGVIQNSGLRGRIVESVNLRGRFVRLDGDQLLYVGTGKGNAATPAPAAALEQLSTEPDPRTGIAPAAVYPEKR